MKSDLEIKEDVLDELIWQPNIDVSQIRITVHNGVVNLNGILEGQNERFALETAVMSVDGVKELYEGNIKVMENGRVKKPSDTIKKSVIHTLRSNPDLLDDDIKVNVKYGWVYLSGTVQSAHNRWIAKNTVEKLVSVNGVINNLELKHQKAAMDVKDKIKKSLELTAEIVVKNISVFINGNTVTLKGTVNSIREKRKAEMATFIVPGVIKIKNKLKVKDPFQEYAPFGFIYK